MIHKTAIVSSKAEIDTTVKVGPYSVIDDNVKIDSNTNQYFKLLKQSAVKLNLTELSMGMSSDFEKAIINGSTYLRLGTAILGERSIK